MKKTRYLINLAYDGTFFHGWQIQKNERTVQGVVENALTIIQKEKIKITGSGRTDAGVHALNQYAHVDLIVNMTTEQLTKALNSLLPEDILIKKISIVPSQFHARYSAKERTYKYIFSNNINPFTRFYKGFFPNKNIDLNIMKKGLPFFLGTNDFTSFSKFNPNLHDQICNITSSTIEQFSDDYIFTISANRFLHNMVRRIVGTIVNISHFREDPAIVEQLINNKNPSHKLIATVPPDGLFLQDILYHNVRSSVVL